MELIIVLLIGLVVASVILLLAVSLVREIQRNRDQQFTLDRLRGQLDAALRITRTARDVHGQGGGATLKAISPPPSGDD